MAPRGKSRPPALPPLPCPLTYGADGRWTSATISAAHQCVRNNLERDVDWWRQNVKKCGSRAPDIDGTLCRLRMHSPRSVLTNMMLVRSSNGRLSASILLDPGDERGPLRHWPARTVAALQMLAAVQQRIDDGLLPPLPNLTAILNPHDQPQQFAHTDWCGLAPILSNSRVSGTNRDLLMPDFSFAPFGYLTNMIDANMSSTSAVPRGWPIERQAIYAAGRRLPYAKKRRALFWRGGITHVQRRVYSSAITNKTVTLPSEVSTDVFLCGAHCTVEAGVPPEGWCDNQQLLSLPGHSFAVGFKYTMLCSSVVVRGAHADVPCETAKHACPRVFEQFWHAGLKADEHFIASHSIDDLPDAVRTADRHPAAAQIAARSADYAYHLLDPDFITDYWHTLLKGYASLFDWALAERASPADVCERPHRKAPLHPAERVCFRGPKGMCLLKLLGDRADRTFVPIPGSAEMARECNSTLGMQRLYRRFVRVIPLRFTGGGNVSDAASTALKSFFDGSNEKAPRPVAVPG